MKLLLLVICIFVSSTTLLSGKTTSEGLLNKLLAPGPLSINHSMLEKIDCFECHDALAGIPDKKCINCHQSIKGSTFHQAQSKSCRECHSEHRGRESDLSKFDHKNFDHGKTSFELKHSHQKLECNECHKAIRGSKRVRSQDISFQGSDKRCVSCHFKDDIHQSSKLEDCSKCHTEKSFKDARFDHLKETGYLLDSNHQNLSCVECHQKGTYRFPQKCASCHSTSNFKHQQFGFKLDHAHARLDCFICHKDFRPKELSSDCNSCHKPSHKDFKRDCLECHSMDGFKVENLKDDFKHAKFLLNGAHEKLSCNKCHSDKFKFELLSSRKESCLNCHQNPHKDDITQNCESCHTTYKWNVGQNFHRNMKLSGEHLKLQCQDCHRKEHFKDVTNNCVQCHKKSDPHKGTLPRCQDCHGQNNFQITRFNHSSTRFPLMGLHRNLNCSDCHRSGKVSTLSMSCISCHLKDAKRATNPPHPLGDFSKCDQCHSVFRQW